MNKLELLAPAGDMECFKIAVDNGADAIYLGLPQFNARMKAQNFSYEELEEAVRYAHLRGVKVYITLNILLHDSEFISALEGVEKAVSLGVDAFIIQDLGLISILKKLYKDIEIHLSTQAGIHNLEGAKVCEKLGVKRVVLARETKLKDIKEIRDNTNLELEYFVQGALCVAFSGNCYLSSKLFNMSGNRGLCKQLCRLPYTLALGGDTLKGYPLSTKDFCMLESLGDLIEAGITSFKIEGRMRRPNYVGEAVSAYRKALDENLSKKDYEFLERKLKISFNRGFTYRGYLDKNVGIINSKSQNHVGVKIGVVGRVKPFKNLFSVVVETKEILSKGDGLKFFLKGKEVGSLGVGAPTKVKDGYEIITSRKVPTGAEVHLIEDSKRLELFKTKHRECKVKVSLSLEANKQLFAEVMMDDLIIKKSSDFILDNAKSRPLDKDTIIDIFKKTGDTGLDIEVEILALDNIFAPRSILNDFRRNLYQEVVEKLINKNEKITHKSDEYDEVINSIKNTKSIVNANISEGLNKDLCNISNNNVLYYVNKNTKNIFLEKGDIVVIQLDLFTYKNLENILNEYIQYGKVLLELPIVASSDDILVIDKLLNEFAVKISGLVINNLWGLKYLGKFNLIAGQGLNVYNTYQKLTLQSLGVKCVQESMEVEGEVDNCIKTKNYRLPLMTFVHCPYQTLYGGDCASCKYKEGLKLIGERDSFIVERVKVKNCYFSLYKK